MIGGTLLIGSLCVRQKSQPEQRDAFCFTDSLLISDVTNSEAIFIYLNTNRKFPLSYYITCILRENTIAIQIYF